MSRIAGKLKLSFAQSQPATATIPPKDRSAAKAALYELFPDLLEYKPLAIGIRKVLRPVYLASGWSGTDFNHAMQAHTQNHKYLRNCVEAGAPRYGANGQPHGVVSEQAAATAKQILATRSKRKKQCHESS